MKTRLLAAGAALVVFAASSATATEIVSITAVEGLVTPAGMYRITDFNSTGGADVRQVGSNQGGAIQDLAPGFTFTQNSGAYTRDGHAGLDANVSAPPPADMNGPVGSFYETILTGGSATLTSARGLYAFSFYMGSPDEYNGLTLTFNGPSGADVLTGNAIWGGHPPGLGTQTLGYTVTYLFNPDTVHSVKFTSTGNSFEFDKLYGATVPEPASWALMIMGFGMAGGMMRAGRRTRAAA